MKFREILREFELIAVQCHPNSSILLSIESAYATRLPINSNFWVYLFRNIDV